MLTNLADILHDAGLVVHEGAGWQTRGYLGRSLDAVHGIIVHHTAENRSANPAAMARMLSVGRQGLPGPLCHLYLDRRGEWWVIAAGWANHAGSGGFRNLGGNRDTVGVEAANDGLGEPWLDRQMDSWVRGVAAVADAYNVPTDLIIAHREWTPRKPDPKNVNMGVFRARVEATRGAMPFTSDEEAQLKSFVWAIREAGSDAGGLVQVLVPLLRAGAPWTSEQVAELRDFAAVIIARDSDGGGFADTVIRLVRNGLGEFTADDFATLRQLLEERVEPTGGQE